MSVPVNKESIRSEFRHRDKAEQIELQAVTRLMIFRELMNHDFAINRFHSFDVPLLEVLETFSRPA
jgi:hypothetical protein